MVCSGLISGYDLLMGWSVVDGCWWVWLWNRHGSMGCEIGMGPVVARLAWIGVGGVGHGWWVLVVGMGGAGFASFSFFGGGGFDECGCGWVCDWWCWRWWLMVVTDSRCGCNGGDRRGHVRSWRDWRGRGEIGEVMLWRCGWLCYDSVVDQVTVWLINGFACGWMSVLFVREKWGYFYFILMCSMIK